MQHSFWYYSFVFFGLMLAGYFLVVGSLYWLLYSALEQMLETRKLHRLPPTQQGIRRDIELTIVSVIVFALSAAIILFLFNTGTTLIYVDLEPGQVWYGAVSFAAVILLQDAYFYFTHRALHHPRLFKRLHHGHHQSGDPTPWTSFAFDLLDAIVQAIFLVGVVFIIPLHLITLVAVLMTMTIASLVHHLGFEPLPASSSYHWLRKWVIDSTHHAIHHRKYKVHYGLYFTFWDRWLGTQDPNYEYQIRSTHIQSSLNNQSRQTYSHDGF
ncbi:sterol desaturase family protein [Leptolyngbya sp. NIES-2104]|uniref:sterol desaturase family protein n=1 Tax=Leptolyngbya sp. NIES-2104 TaxID=1552121 RepID=UPI00092FBEFD|nr:sterol desaturase family protein [Leptolyngbya sp. NIES-2104]